MQKLLIGVLMLVSFSAQAATWELINSEYSLGNGWICTYQLQGSNYTRTILQESMCQMFIWN